MRIRPMLVAVTVLFTGALALATDQKLADSKAEVPALSSFHEVIYVIWHEAWPEKDAAAGSPSNCSMRSQAPPKRNGSGASSECNAA